MSCERKEEIKKVSGKELYDVIDKGPEFAFEKLQEFTNDVSTLTQRMADLYHADEETAMLFAMLGVAVKVTVTMGNGESTLGEFGVGAEVHHAPKEDTNGIQEQ